jgi:hypothetical protein
MAPLTYDALQCATYLSHHWTGFGLAPTEDVEADIRHGGANVQQNAVDAEFGNSSGSAMSLTSKSGTNQWHGSGFYREQYPWANALENRVFRTVNMGARTCSVERWAT